MAFPFSFVGDLHIDSGKDCVQSHVTDGMERNPDLHASRTDWSEI